MIFDHSDLYDQEVDFDLLRMADLTYCPSAYLDNESHFIYYNYIDSDPIWCSDPAEGKSISPKQFVEKIAHSLVTDQFRSSQFLLLDELMEPIKTEQGEEGGKVLDLVKDSLTFIRYEG